VITDKPKLFINTHHIQFCIWL